MTRGLVAVLAVLVLGGCSGLSAHSEVQAGLEVGGGGDLPVSVLPQGPVPGATPEQVVGGFLRASAANDNSLDVAREFLTRAAAQRWAPDTGVTVYTQRSDVTVTGSGSERTLTVPVTAYLSADGRYRPARRGAHSTARLRMAKEGGQWRIASLPERFGLWLSDSDLARLYSPFSIHYVSQRERTLIPDVRWFPVGPSLSTRLARAQLEEVPAYLRGAVSSGIPVGSTLAGASVPITNGTAIVDVAAPAPSTDQTRRMAMWAQFLATLHQVPGVRRVELRLEGAKVDLGDQKLAPSSITQLGFSADSDPDALPILRSHDQLREVAPGRVVTERDLSRPARTTAGYPPIPIGWTQLALSRSGQEMTATGGDGLELSRWRGGRRIDVPRFAGGLTRAAYDPQDVIWVGAGESLWTINSAADPKDAVKSAPARLPVPWLRGRTVKAVRISRDGQRIVVVSAGPGGSRVDVAGIVRLPNGLPTALAEPLRIGSTLTTVVDAVWADQTAVAVLGRDRETDPVRPVVVGLDGAHDPLLPVEGAQWITTTGGARGLVVGTDEGEVRLRAGGRWLLMARGSDLAVPGM